MLTGVLEERKCESGNVALIRSVMADSLSFLLRYAAA